MKWRVSSRKGLFLVVLLLITIQSILCISDTAIGSNGSPIEAEASIDPAALNPMSKGKFATVYIRLPYPYSVEDIDGESIRIESAIMAKRTSVSEEEENVLIAKFGRQEVLDVVQTKGICRELTQNIALELTGQLNDQTPLEAIAVIEKVLWLTVCTDISYPLNGTTINELQPELLVTYEKGLFDIDLGSFYSALNGTDISSMFSVSSDKATYQLTTDLSEGENQLTASIDDHNGYTGIAESIFNVSSTTRLPIFYFSVLGIDGIFVSPGDGTYGRWLHNEDLDAAGQQVTSIYVTNEETVFFSLAGDGTIYESDGDATRAIFLYHIDLGIPEESTIEALFLQDDTIYFTLAGQTGIYQSYGDGTFTQFVASEELGIPGYEVDGLHIDYSGVILFSYEEGTGVFQSTADGTNSQFLVDSDLGVPGYILDAFARLPDQTEPTISILHPSDGSLLNTTTPNIIVSFSDDESGIDPSTFYAEINGTDMTSAFTVTNSGASYQVPQGSELPVGENSLYVVISDLVGNSSNVSSNFTVGILRAIPSATPLSGTAPLTVHFSADGEDPAGTIEIFRWDFNGDGNWDTYDTVASDYTRTYNTPGTYNVTLYVQSNTGQTASASITITVENNPPVASADVIPSNGEVPLTVQMTGTGSDVDGYITLYEWDFDGDGTFDWSSTTSGNSSYTYSAVGTYQAIFRVTDDVGLTATATAYTTVIEANPPGSPSVTASATPTEGQAPLTVNFSGTATDPNNDVVLYEWDFDGDGTYDWSSPSSGGTTHTYTQAGLHVARFRATDSTGLTGSDQVGITVNLDVSLSVSNDTVGILSDRINLTGMGGVTVTASSIYEQCSTYYPVSYLRDGNESTFWMSEPGDTPNQGASTYVETIFNSPRTVAQINIKGGSNYQYYGITRARIELFDDTDNSLYSAEHDLPQDAQVLMGTIENVTRFKLTALTANDGGGAYNQVSIAEIALLDDTGFTATASSTYDYNNYYEVDNLFDGDIYNTLWVSSMGDHPDMGVYPWIEVSFVSPQSISRVIIDQGPYYYDYGTTRSRIELMDGTGNILYSEERDLPTDSEVIDLPRTQDVQVCRFTILSANNNYNQNICVISELNILEEQNGQYISLVQTNLDQGAYTASSEWKTNCYSNYPASNIIDGNIQTYWLSAQYDTPDNGVNPVVEITFPSSQTVSQIVVDGQSNYYYYGITRALIELLDSSDNVLYSQEHDLQSITEIDLPDISGVIKVRFTATGNNDPYNYNMCGWSEITLYQNLDDPEPTTTDINTSISADTTVSIFVVDSEGNLIRTLVNNEFRQQGVYADNWDLNGDDGFPTVDGLYYVIMEYIDKDGQTTQLDLTNTTGGTRNHFPIGNGCNMRSGTWTENFSPFDDEKGAYTFTLCSAKEVTFFIGPLWGGSDPTRVRTILNRQPFPAGTHTIYWDGLDDNGNIAQAPSGDSLITGAWLYDLPDNAIYRTGVSPELSNVSADPNYYSPFSEKCDQNGNGEGVLVNYSVSEDVAAVELRVYSIESGSLLRLSNIGSATTGENVLFWDGKNNNGEYVDIGDYRIGLIVADSEGNQSMFRYTLVRIDY